MVHRTPIFWAPIVFAAALLFAAWHLRQAERSVLGDFVVVALGVVVISVAIAYYRSADALGLMMEQRAAKSAFTAAWHSGHIRGISILGVALGILFVCLGAALLRSS